MKILRTLKTAATDWLEDGATQLSAALAYYSIFSLAPLLLIAVAAAGLFLDQEVIQRTVEQYLKHFVGDGGPTWSNR